MEQFVTNDLASKRLIYKYQSTVAQPRQSKRLIRFKVLLHNLDKLIAHRAKSV